MDHKDIVKIKDILDPCITESRIVSSYLTGNETGRMSLGRLGSGYIGQAAQNLRMDGLLPADDFVDICTEYVRERFGDKAAADTGKVIRTGVIEAADHLGGFYSPQSAQGNIIYADMIKKHIDGLSYIPVFSCGIVPVQNTANPRGLVCFEGVEEPVRCNVIPRRYHNVTVTGMKAYDEKMLDVMMDQIRKSPVPVHMKDAMTEIARGIYGRDDILKLERYAEQLVRIGTLLTEKMFERSDRPAFIYIENEYVFRQLIIRELEMGETLFCRLLSDPVYIDCMNDTTTGEGRNTFSMSLFVGLDENGWRHFLNLDRDGRLRGRTFHGDEVEYDASTQNLIRLIREERIYPSILSQVIVTAFERGIMWSCGIFASEYIPEWQKRLADMILTAGRTSDKDYAEMISPLNISSYISGPVFMLAPAGKGRLANLASLELYARRPDTDTIDRLLETSASEGHLMGLYEFYNDIVPGNVKTDGWYQRLAAFYGENFKKNILT